MNLVYGISRRTNASRAIRHIDNTIGTPLCGSKRKILLWEADEEGEPTCKKCIAKYKCLFCGEPATGFVLSACTCNRCGRHIAREFEERGK